MMVDLEDDPEWSVSDELDDEDAERYKEKKSVMTESMINDFVIQVDLFVPRY